MQNASICALLIYCVNRPNAYMLIFNTCVPCTLHTITLILDTITLILEDICENIRTLYCTESP